MSESSLIAIVDDDEAMREALFDLLSVEGFRAITFADAEAFLEQFEIRETACLITDIRMPGLDGVDLQRRLRARGSALPVIFVTSDEDEATRAFAMASGATAYFTKPLANAELIKVLAEILGPGRGS